MSRFRGEPVPATGFSIGVSRLLAALQHLGKVETKAELGPVVVTVFDQDRIADYQQMVAELRAANIRAELYLGNPKNIGNQLKYADKRDSPCVVIQGGDEKAQRRSHDQGSGPRRRTRQARKRAARNICRSRPRRSARCRKSDLVDAVREVLARHGLTPG